jgi:pimeloyl-ACP methyl ester carboxylesterase
MSVKVTVSAIAAGSLTLLSPAAVHAQPTVTPLLLVGGTLVDHKFSGYSDVPGWTATVLNLNGIGYTPWTDLFIGEMCKDTSGATSYDRTLSAVVDQHGFRFSVGFLKCRLSCPLQPFNDDCEVPPQQSPGWNYPLGWLWPTFVSRLKSAGGSTAGLAPMQVSVDYIIEQIQWIQNATGKTQVDIAAHSQGGSVARAVVRQLKQANLDAPSRVRRLITLGTPHYGASPATIVLNLFAGTWLAQISELFTRSFINQCRDQTILPMCPDLFLTPPSEGGHVDVNGVVNESPRFVSGWPYYFGTHDYDGVRDPLTGTLTYNTPMYRPFSYASAFFPTLNSTANVGPIVPDTEYFNLYTRDHNGGGVTDGEQYIVEQMRLYPDRSNVHNWNYQDVHSCQENMSDSYPVAHIHEWDDPLALRLVLEAIGFESGMNPACLCRKTTTHPECRLP